MSEFLESYGQNNVTINRGEHKVEGTVNLPLSEVDRLRAAIVNRDRVIRDLEEKQKKIKITLKQNVTKTRWQHPIGHHSYEEQYEDWEEINSYKNLDDIMDGLKATIKQEVTENYSNRLEISENKVDTLHIKLSELQIKYNTCNEELPILKEKLLEEKSKNTSIKQDYVMVVSEREVLERNLEKSRDREIRLTNLLENETFWAKFYKFFGGK